jgi:amidase
MDKLVFATAVELAAAIRQGDVSASEVLDAHLAQIARHNPGLNALVTLDTEQARQRALAADAARARGELWGPLHGVPVTIKDSFETAGLRTTSGYPPLADHVPAEDAPPVARLRAAGAIVLAKSNLPTMAGDAQTNNPLFGRSHNPWSQAHTPGGSSGGGAAAVAAGLSPLDLGSDYAGSLRIPAHFCGIYTIKPTDHRVPNTGHIPPFPGLPRGVRHMPQGGPLARSVDDLTLALRLIAGPDGREWEVPPVPLEPAPERQVRSLRLAWTDELGGVTASAETAAALERLAGALAGLGASVERAFPRAFDMAMAWETWGELSQAEIGSSVTPEEEVAVARFGADRDSEVLISRGVAQAVGASMRQYAAILTRRDSLISALEQFLSGWDALLCPVTLGPAFTHRPTSTPIVVDGRPTPYWAATLSYTTPFSLTGSPVVVLPLARSAEGLPIGVQLVGRRWGDMELLAVAAQLAAVIGPWQPPQGY